MVKYLKKTNNNIVNSKNYSNYLYFMFGKFFFYNNSVFYKNYILSSFFKSFFLFNNFFATLSFFKKFTWNKSCKLPLKKLFKKKFKYVKDSTRTKIKVKRPSFKKIWFKKGTKWRQRRAIKAAAFFRTKINTDIFKQFNFKKNLNTENNTLNNSLVKKNNNKYFFLNYMNFFSFFLNKKKFKILKNNLKRKFFFLYNLYLVDDDVGLFKHERLVNVERKFIFIKSSKLKNITNIIKEEKKKKPIFFKKKFLIVNNVKFYEHLKNSLVLLLSGGLCRLDFLKTFFLEFSKFFNNKCLFNYLINFNFFFKKNYINFKNFYMIELFSEIFIRKLAYTFDLYNIFNDNKNNLLIFLIFFFKKNYTYCTKINTKDVIKDFHPAFRDNREYFFKKNHYYFDCQFKKDDMSVCINNTIEKQIDSLYDIVFVQSNVFYNLNLFNFIFLKLTDKKIFYFIKNYYFLRKVEIFNFEIMGIIGLWFDSYFTYYFIDLILSNKLLTKVHNSVSLNNSFIKHDLNKFASYEYLKPTKNKAFKRFIKKKIRLKFPTWRRIRRKKIKYKKIYRLILKDFFSVYTRYSSSNFFKNINSSYGFISLNFFFFFLNSIFIEEQITDFEQDDWDLTTTVSLRQMKKRLFTNSNDHLLYNNHLPILADHKHLKVKFVRSLRNIASLSLNKFHQIFFVSLFETLFKKKFFIRYESNFFRRYKPKNLAKILISDYKNVNWKILRSLHMTEVIEIIWYSFQFRDLRLLNNWLKKIMPMLKLKHHQVLIDKLKNLLEGNGTFFRRVLRLNGFFFKIKGKISVTGNAKKRNSFIRFGSIDLSSKSKKLDYEEGEINTRVGILGYKMFLSYNT